MADHQRTEDMPPTRERHPNHHHPGSSGDAPTRARRKLTLSACDPCRRRKTKCDGQRPTCSTCINKPNHQCTWEVQDPLLSRMAALRRQIADMDSQIERNGAHHKSATSLIDYLMTRPEAEAHIILERLRSTKDVAGTVQYVREGDLLISGVLAPEPGAQGEDTTPMQVG